MHTIGVSKKSKPRKTLANIVINQKNYDSHKKHPHIVFGSGAILVSDTDDGTDGFAVLF